MAPLIHSSWWRQLRTSADNETPVTFAGDISVAITMDGSSDSGPFTSSPLDKPSSGESTASDITSTFSTPTQSHSSEESTTPFTTTSPHVSALGSTTSPRSSSSVATNTSPDSSDVTTRTAGDGPRNTTWTSTTVPAPTTSSTLTKTPGNGQDSTSISSKSSNASPSDLTTHSTHKTTDSDPQKSPTATNPISPNPAFPNDQLNPTHASGGVITNNISSSSSTRGPPTMVAQAESAPMSSITSVPAEVIESKSKTTFTSGHSTFTKEVTIFSTRLRTSTALTPTSTVVGTTTSGTKSKTAAMIGGMIGVAILVLAGSLLAWYLIRRRRRNEKNRVLFNASPDPFPHSSSPSLQALSPVSPLGSPHMTTHTYPSTLAPQLPSSDTNPPVMVEKLNNYPPSTSVTARKKLIPFLDNLDLGKETRLSVPPISSLPMDLSSGQAYTRPVAAEDPFADPDHNPFDDSRPMIPAVVVHPATPEPRNSDMSALSGPKEYGIAV